MVRHGFAFALILTLTAATTSSRAQESGSPIRVFLDPFGGDETGEADFLAVVALDDQLGSGETLLFDNLNLWPNNETVSAVTADSVQLALLGNTGRGAPFVFHPNGFYDWEGQMYGGTVVMGSVGGFMPTAEGKPLAALGFWIFDDGYLRDSYYQVDVVDACGNETTAFVENDVPRVRGYEVEGFFGVVADCGIVSVTVTSLDTATGEPWNDPFEIDYLTVVRIADPPPDDDGSKCGCPCPRCDGDWEHPGRGCEHGRGHGRCRLPGREIRNDDRGSGGDEDNDDDEEDHQAYRRGRSSRSRGRESDSESE